MNRARKNDKSHRPTKKGLARNIFLSLSNAKQAPGKYGKSTTTVWMCETGSRDN